MKLAWTAYSKIPTKCCVYNLWKDEEGYTKCTKCATQDGCKLKHTDKPSEAVTSSDLYNLLKEKFGPPNGPGKQRPKENKKSGSD